MAITRSCSDGSKYTFPDGTDETSIAFSLFHLGPVADRFTYLRQAIDLHWNKHFPNAFMWNEWTELMLSSFCENTVVTVTGPGASWKTTSFAIYAVCKFYSSPADTVVILTSTTLPGLRRRIWKEVTRYYRMRTAMGNLVQSTNSIQFQKGSDEAGIFGIATDKGEISKAVGKIIGFHAPNVLVGVDEMQYTSEAIVEAGVNLESGADNFQFIGLGNADDQLDPHGRMSEPENGWDSIMPESQSWKTKRGICLHLDGLEAPNVKAGKVLYPGMLNQRDLDNTIRDYGADSPQWWQMRRGFWAPEGISRTVLSASIIAKFKAKEKIIWNSNFQLGAGLDPAFGGGDRIILRIGKCGADMDGKLILSLCDIIQIKVLASSAEPIHYQIVRQVKEACIERGIPPSMFALDSTGEGGGLASIFQREWSPEVLCVEFGGRPSKRPVSGTNPKPSDQEYMNRVTELWYQFRLLVMNGQIRDLDNDTAAEFCQRKVEQRGNLTMLETKALMKERTKRSPDLADATVVLTELFLTRRSDFHAAAVTHESDARFLKWREKLNVNIEEEAYVLGSLN